MRLAGILFLALHGVQASAALRANHTARPDAARAHNTTLTTGSEYAQSCQSRLLSYTSAYNQWSRDHQITETLTQAYGGVVETVVTGYKDGSTLCDGHARVPHSPALPLSTTTYRTYAGHPASIKVYTDTYWSNFPEDEPSCTIRPTDCDGLWKQYSASTSASPMITLAPTPPCMNSSEAALGSSVQASMHGCGACTIYGDEVQLLYFPITTSVSRDMCATTPRSKMTRMRDDDDVEVHAGKHYGHPPSAGAITAVVGGHTFTSGTAYISIGSVYAMDRCTKNTGTTVTDVILAMPSESVLSMRYSQDHFQYFGSSTLQEGYPVSYADFQQPIPWSAWNGQAICECPGGNCGCDVIYEDQYRPQLAIPAAITRLDPAFKTCAFWYRGLYDPPSILTPATEFATPTYPATAVKGSETIAAPATATTVAVEPGSGLQLPPSATSKSVVQHTSHPGTVSPNFHGAVGTAHFSIVTITPTATPELSAAPSPSRHLGSLISALFAHVGPPEQSSQAGQTDQTEHSGQSGQAEQSEQLLSPTRSSSPVPVVYKIFYATVTLAPSAEVVGSTIVTQTAVLAGTTYTVLQGVDKTEIVQGTRTVTISSAAVTFPNGVLATVTASEVVFERSTPVLTVTPTGASSVSSGTATGVHPPHDPTSKTASGDLISATPATANGALSGSTQDPELALGFIGKNASTMHSVGTQVRRGWWLETALTAAAVLYRYM